MRMTNKIMENNSLYNINNNKIMQDKLSTQFATGKKLTRPSDDPIVAIRALRLRTSVSELTQYYEKNIPDANAWLKVTEGALDTTVKVLEDLYKEAEKAANKDLTYDDLRIHLDQMKLLRDEFYSTGNVDYAGRYVFTGYRTDTSLTFPREVEDMNPQPSYKIKENIGFRDIDTVNHTDISDVADLNKNNYDQYFGKDETGITNGDVQRIRLAYDNLNENKDKTPTIEYIDKNGTKQTITVKDTMEVSDDPYQAAIDDPNAVIFVPETGEILLGADVYADIVSNATDDTVISVEYTKDSWKDGDLRPQHYFECTGTFVEDGIPREVKYNQPGEEVDGQIIEYDVGYNQRIRINTLAGESFTHALDRDIDDLEAALAELEKINASRDDLDKVLERMSEDDPDYADTLKLKDAVGKAYDYVREKVHNMFENAMTKMKDHQDLIDEAVTDCGTRSKRVSLVENRLMDQKTTFETLQSENEDIDIAEVMVKLTSVELIYNAALMATGKIMQNSLMNYI